MLTPPEQFVQHICRMGLCSERDIQRCAPLVSRLCGDLPAFESIWLDAMTQRNLLTRWQAEMLDSNRSGALRLDSLLLLRPLGSDTFVAESADSRHQCAARILTRDALGESGIALLNSAVSRMSRIPDASSCGAAVPRRTVIDGNRVAIISEFIDGWTLRELLTRRGRFAPALVASIGRSLLQAFALLEKSEVVHGRVTADRVRLSHRGNAVLVGFDPFRSEPGISIRAGLTLKEVDGLAPERIGTARPPDARSELYSLGCLLWELLAGRSVFLTADPVSRLIVSQQTDPEDVRNRNPDCPDWLAHAIQKLTSRHAQHRPSDATEALAMFRGRCGRDRHKLASAVRAAGKPIRASRRLTTGRVIRTGQAIALAAGLAAAVWVGADNLPLPLSMTRTADSAESVGAAEKGTTQTIREDSAPAAVSGHVLVPLPAPDPDGIILLEADTWYAAGDVDSPGTIRLQSDAANPAVVAVAAGESLRLAGRQIALEGVRILRIGALSANATRARDQTSDQAAPPLILVSSQLLVIRDSQIQAATGSSQDELIQWSRTGEGGGIVQVRDSVLYGHGYGLSLLDVPRRLEWQNSLFVLRSAALRCDVHSSSDAAIELFAQGSTIRGGRGVLDVLSSLPGSANLVVRLTGDANVFATESAILRVASTQNETPARIRLDLPRGESDVPNLLPPGLEAAVVYDSQLPGWVRLDTSRVDLASVITATPVFVAEAGSILQDGVLRPGGQVLLDYDGPKMSADLPGWQIPVRSAAVWSEPDDGGNQATE